MSTGLSSRRRRVTSKESAQKIALRVDAAIGHRRAPDCEPNFRLAQTPLEDLLNDLPVATRVSVGIEFRPQCRCRRRVHARKSADNLRAVAAQVLTGSMHRSRNLSERPHAAGCPHFGSTKRAKVWGLCSTRRRSKDDACGLELREAGTQGVP